MSTSNLDIIARPAAILECVHGWRKQGLRVALVPTMGNLHQGHATLVAKAREHADRVVVSVFVNPLQFGPNEDFQAYPRTPAEDCALLTQYQADVLFAPDVSDMYPQGMDNHTMVQVPELSDILCGVVRPGHFVGVATVVAKLFNVVQPDVALFGEKDFQQLAIIKRMTIDLGMPLQVIGIETVREADGLAMSSRNRYLSAEQRALSPRIFAVLSAVASQLQQGQRDFAQLEQSAVQQLMQSGFKPDYVSIRDADTLHVPGAQSRKLVVLTAARLGRARLIDNVQVAISL
ncbi:MAG: pantoate--beta-alanine ligase [Steroidobacteraceae bacterium]